MAVYKIPQDVEAEDKLLGPLTFKQFIFFLVAVFAAVLAWFLFRLSPFIAMIPVPVVLIFGGLAFFRREDQPAEQYLASFLNFLIKPRKRIWDPEGYYEHLVITTPKKKAPAELKKNVREVHGQLEKLAQVVDTRGWAAKRAELTLPNQGSGLMTDDRLFMPENAFEPIDIHQQDDILDDANPNALELDSLIRTTSEKQRQTAIERMRSLSDAARQPTAPQAPAGPAYSTTDDDKTDSPSNHKPNSGILELAENDELSISQIAAQANRKSDSGQLQIGEEISLR